MEKLTVKITLNPKNYFDARLIERLKREENMAGALKALAYERLTIEDLVVRPLSGEIPPAAVPEAPMVTPAIDPEEEERRRNREVLERDVDQKIDHMFNKF